MTRTSQRRDAFVPHAAPLAHARAAFHSSQLIRSLADMSLVDTSGYGNAFAEKISQWIHFADAILLSALHNDAMTDAANAANAANSAHRENLLSAQSARPEARDSIAIQYDRTRTSMANRIAVSFSTPAGRSHLALPSAMDIDIPLNPKAAYLPYRRFYEAHQRDMEAGIQPLRTNAREAAERAGMALKKLADLDVLLEKILRERESRLLAKIPLLLGMRFTQLLAQHQDRLAEHGRTDRRDDWMKEGGWLWRFCSDMRTLLLAEMDLRLQPALGLAEALGSLPGETAGQTPTQAILQTE